MIQLLRIGGGGERERPGRLERWPDHPTSSNGAGIRFWTVDRDVEELLQEPRLAPGMTRYCATGPVAGTQCTETSTGPVVVVTVHDPRQGTPS